MKLNILFLAAAAAAVTGGAGAHAAPLFYSTFENVPGAPTSGNFTTVASADGWTGAAFTPASGSTQAQGGIELQNHIAGDPAPDGGNIFVELDTGSNSYMTRTIADPGTYYLSYEYSPRPGNPSSSNGIESFIGGAAITPPGIVTATGGANTSWSTITASFTTTTANEVLEFAAEGTSDSQGGYIDNIKVSAAPEPSTWALMIAGFGMIGMVFRQAKRKHGFTFARAIAG